MTDAPLNITRERYASWQYHRGWDITPHDHVNGNGVPVVVEKVTVFYHRDTLKGDTYGTPFGPWLVTVHLDGYSHRQASMGGGIRWTTIVGHEGGEPIPAWVLPLIEFHLPALPEGVPA